MNTKRFLLSVIVVFGFIFGLDWYIHGQILMDTYKATAHLWRPMDQANPDMTYCKYMILSQLAQAFLIAYIFTRHYEARGLGEGLRYGLYIGLLLAALDLGKYAYMPVDFPLVASWMGASLLTGVGSGVILSYVYKS